MLLTPKAAADLFSGILVGRMFRSERSVSKALLRASKGDIRLELLVADMSGQLIAIANSIFCVIPAGESGESN